MIRVYTRAVRATFANLVDDLRRAAQPMLIKQGEAMEDWVGKYPPESEANRPRYGTWGPFYKRGTGGMYLYSDGALEQTSVSEQLGDHWSTYLSDVTEVTVENPVSYASDVHGPGGYQADYHGARGWRRIDEAAEMFRDKFVDGVVGVIHKVLGQ